MRKIEDSVEDMKGSRDEGKGDMKGEATRVRGETKRGKRRRELKGETKREERQNWTRDKGGGETEWVVRQTGRRNEGEERADGNEMRRERRGETVGD